QYIHARLAKEAETAALDMRDDELAHAIFGHVAGLCNPRHLAEGRFSRKAIHVDFDAVLRHFCRLPCLCVFPTSSPLMRSEASRYRTGSSRPATTPISRATAYRAMRSSPIRRRARR